MDPNSHEADIARQTLERYSGSSIDQFRSNLILTNFPRYVQYFAQSRKVEIHKGASFEVAHCPEEDVTILDFKIGSPAAALVVDICSFLPSIRAAIFLGTCGGLRRRYHVGEYLVPVASVRGEGTSDIYFPHEVPALANFLMQKAVTQILEEEKAVHHIGITFTTNTRFWEFNEDFKTRLKNSKAQGVEMECATLFSASYKRRFTLGALLLITDLPLDPKGIKTKESSKMVYENFTSDHVEKGVRILKVARDMQSRRVKGAYHSNILPPKETP
jgi:AMP nucleosidase